jgi:hypothetical protein
MATDLFLLKAARVKRKRVKGALTGGCRSRRRDEGGGGLAQ